MPHGTWSHSEYPGDHRMNGNSDGNNRHSHYPNDFFQAAPLFTVAIPADGKDAIQVFAPPDNVFMFPKYTQVRNERQKKIKDRTEQIDGDAVYVPEKRRTEPAVRNQVD